MESYFTFGFIRTRLYNLQFCLFYDLKYKVVLARLMSKMAQLAATNGIRIEAALTMPFNSETHIKSRFDTLALGRKINYIIILRQIFQTFRP